MKEFVEFFLKCFAIKGMSREALEEASDTG